MLKIQQSNAEKYSQNTYSHCNAFAKRRDLVIITSARFPICAHMTIVIFCDIVGIYYSSTSFFHFPHMYVWRLPHCEIMGGKPPTITTMAPPKDW